MSEGRGFDLIDLARCAGASDRFVQSFIVLERTEAVVRKCRSYSGDTPSLGRLADLAGHLLHLSRLEVDAALDRDDQRAARLRRRFWLAQDELYERLGRLALELAELVG